jgi:hypothetical protein
MTSLFPVVPAHALAATPTEKAWLIDGLWANEAVGIIGGEPKCCKSFLALDLAVSLAAGLPCLRRFPVPTPGPVLLYAAEDALHTVRQRLEGICLAAGACFEYLDVQVITAPTLRLDLEADRQRLSDTIDAHKPRLLVLDPFVRLHRIDENASAEVAPLLAFLRELNRAHHLAVALVHHAKKGANLSRPGQALRGSSELHAWGDSNLYLRRSNQSLLLTTEHRAAPSVPTIPLALRQKGQALALTAIDPSENPGTNLKISPLQKVQDVLTQADRPVSLTEIRALSHLRTQTVSDAVTALIAQHHVIRTPEGYTLYQE